MKTDKRSDYLSMRILIMCMHVPFVFCVEMFRLENGGAGGGGCRCFFVVVVVVLGGRQLLLVSEALVLLHGRM